MRKIRFALVAMLFAVPLATVAKAQVSVGIGIGPAVVADPYAYDDYGYSYAPPICAWGYYPYYPYTCAPYGYYGPQWFTSGIFIGTGPWYGWGWRHTGYYGGRYWGGSRYWYGNHGYAYRGGYGGYGD